MGIADATLILHAEGRASITFDTLSIDGATAGYYVPAETLIFNEAEREQIVYSEGANIDGGEYITSFAPLVDVSFTCYCWGDTRVAAIQRAQALKLAVGNEHGGQLQYMPADVITRSTYYHYVKSPIPPMADVTDNTWDSRLKATQSIGNKYVVVLEVVLKTMPVATSDPDNLVALSLSRSTLDDHVYGAAYNYFDITGSAVKGDQPAYVRFRARNSQSGTNEEIAKLYLTSRSSLLSTLNYYQHVYQAEDATSLTPTAVWSTPADGSRSGSAYRRCNPGAEYNDDQLGLRFTLSNESHHRGRCTVLGVVRAKTAYWSSQVKYTIAGEVVAYSSAYNYAEHFDKWSIMVLGEIDMPAMIISGLETIAPALEVYFTRSDGSEGDYVDLDFIMLAFNDECLALFSHADGFTNDQKLLFERLAMGKSLAHLINQSTSAFEDEVDAHYGSEVLPVPPGFDTRVGVLFQRIDPVVFEDDFSSYDGVSFLRLAQMNLDESWTEDPSDGTVEVVLDSVVYRVEGDASLKLIPGPITQLASSYLSITPINLGSGSLFTDGDFLCWFVDCLNVSKLSDAIIALGELGAVGPYISSALGDFSLAAGYNFKYVLKTVIRGYSLGMNATSLVGIQYAATDGSGPVFYTDYLRIEKADPDDATRPNATGANWNFQPNDGRWAITYDGPGGDNEAVLACFEQAAVGVATAARDITTPDDVAGFCKIAFRNSTSHSAGIAFRLSDQTLGSEDGYVFILYGYGYIRLMKYVAGTPTYLAEVGLATGNLSLDTWYWLGFKADGNSLKAYLSLTEPVGDSNSEKLANLLSESNLVVSVTDATFSSGSVGAMSHNSGTRFGEFYVEHVEDLHIPADQVTVEAAALFRGVYPFPD